MWKTLRLTVNVLPDPQLPRAQPAVYWAQRPGFKDRDQCTAFAYLGSARSLISQYDESAAYNGFRVMRRKPM
jgi:hypothetical protein